MAPSRSGVVLPMTGFASLVGVLMAVIAVAVLMAACDNGPERVVGTGPTAPSPSALPVVVSLEISGPASIPPGQSAQFAAISRLSDGTSEPASVRWNLSSATYAEVLRVDASGLATAGPRGGEAVLSAALQASPIRSSKEVLVLPAGTYRMVGVVTEAGPEATSRRRRPRAPVQRSGGFCGCNVQSERCLLVRLQHLSRPHRASA
jgi:hypothetical protein